MDDIHLNQYLWPEVDPQISQILADYKLTFCVQEIWSQNRSADFADFRRLEIID